MDAVQEHDEREERERAAGLSLLGRRRAMLDYHVNEARLECARALEEVRSSQAGSRQRAHLERVLGAHRARSRDLLAQRTRVRAAIAVLEGLE